MSYEIDLNSIKDFFELNGYDWEGEVIDSTTGEVRMAAIEDFFGAHLPLLKFNDRVKGVAIDNPYFTLGLFVTDGKFELYDHKSDTREQNDQLVLYDDLSMEWQTYNLQMNR